MKNVLTIGLMILGFCYLNSKAQTVLFSEDFESGEIPLNWREEFKKGSISWRYENGGYTLNPEIPFSRNPMEAHGGSYNALFQYQSLNNEATKLITTKISAIEFAIKPELHFYHAQIRWKHGEDYYNDRLRVYYRTSATGTWKLLSEYTEATTDWVERIILLPENDLSDDYYLAFEGETKWGYGTCVDDIQIVETGILQKYLDSLSVDQPTELAVSSGAQNNPILRVKLKVMGNSGTCPLNSLELTSLNTSDADINSGGVKLFLTTSDDFNTDHQVGSGVSFSGGKASFSGLNEDLPIGYSYLWVTYDVKTAAGHRDTLDAKFAAHSINIDGDTYLTSEQSPAGSRVVLQTLTFEDFEASPQWVLTGEFELGSPAGLGGSQGNADPSSAYSGLNVVGTDLTGLGDYLGDYEKNLSRDDYSALSDTFDFTYYNDLSLRYMRFMNIGVNDEAFIHVSKDGGKTWKKAWENTSMILDNTWKLHEVDITSQAARGSQVIVKYSLGSTNDYWQLSGWNIDNFSITGNYVSKDVGISRVLAPKEGCGHTQDETVRVMVKNYGAEASYSVVPLQYSFHGDDSMVYDTLNQVIAAGDSVEFSFKKKVDLSQSGIYDFSVSARMANDDDASNDAIEKAFYVQPTIVSSDHTETFQTNGGLWRVQQDEVPNWECGTPGFGIEPPSGTKVWMTQLLSNYPDHDSSFVESVCYSNPDHDRKILHLKYWMLSQDSLDGAAIQYSTNNGLSWNLLDSAATGINWYTGDVQSLYTRGWSGSSEGWKSSRIVVPADATNATEMKFRVAFGSDSTSSDIGFAFDDFRISTVPPDLGVTQINSHSDACQFVNPDFLTVTIKNFSVNALKPNDTVMVAFDVNQEQVVIDTFKLTATLAAGQTLQHTFSVPAGTSAPGTYHVRAYTLINENPDFSESANDTSELSFTVFPAPLTSLLDTVQTHQPDTVVLETLFDPDYDYWWNGIAGSETFAVQKAGWQILKVTDTRGNGCSAYDSTNVELLFSDLGITQMLHPINSCGFGKNEYPEVAIRNLGTDSIASGQKIGVTYILNGGTPVVDTLTLASTLYSGSTFNFTFTRGAIDLSAMGTYNFATFTTYGGDTVTHNDTLNQSVIILGRPVVSLGPDRTIQALSYTLDAGAGYQSYLWDNALTTRTRQVTNTGTYWVQVTDANQCDNSDSVYIRLKIRDISPAGFSNPISDCQFNSAEAVVLRLINSGTDTIPSGTAVSVSYQFNGGSRISGTVNISSQLVPGATVLHTFPGTIDLSVAGDYPLEATAVMPGDIRVSNDTAQWMIYRYPKPNVDFGLDDTEVVEGIELSIDAGYSPYWSYQWQDGDTNQVYTATVGGTYRVKATDVRTSCWDGDTVLVLLIYSDVAVTYSSMPVSGCTGDFDHVTVRVTNKGTQSIGRNAPIYVACDVNGIRVTLDTLVRTANFGTNSSLDLNLSGSVPVDQEGVSSIAFYTIYAQDLKPWNDTLNKPFDALPAPVVDFGDINGVLNTTLPHELDAGPGHASYLWQDGSSLQTFTVQQMGIYSVTVVGQNDCVTNKVVRINMTNGLDETTGAAELVMYPNPGHGLFHLSLGGTDNGECLIRIFNQHGQAVYTHKYDIEALEREPIDVQHLHRGVYFISIQYNMKIYEGKLIVL
jgi:hypothetical protein